MDDVRAQLAVFKAQIEALSIRERVLVLVAVLAVVYTAWNIALQGRVESENKRLADEIARTDIRADALKRAVEEMLADAKVDPNLEVRERQSRLNAELEQLKARKAEIATSFLSPESTANLLANVLKERAALHLVSLESVAPQALTETDAKSVDQSNQSESGPMLWRHDIILEFEGAFFDMLDYLRELEGQPLYWDSIDYRVTAYPLARIRLRVFTLSFEKEWLGV